MLFFPALLNFIYSFLSGQIIYIDIGNLLAYYGTLFGILVSFITYRNEINQKHKLSNIKFKPQITLCLNRRTDNNLLFDLIITNHSNYVPKYLYIYDYFITESLVDQLVYRVSFGLTTDQEQLLQPQFNFVIADDETDNTNFPKNIYITCEDLEGKTWAIYYKKINDIDKLYYHEHEFEYLE